MLVAAPTARQKARSLMAPLSWWQMLAWAVPALVAGSVVSELRVAHGGAPLLVTPWLGALFLVVAAALWLLGRGVRNLKLHRETSLTALGAARTAAFAKAAALTGAACVGFGVGVLVVGITRLWAPAMAASALGAGIAAVGAAVMTATAWVVERWCRDDDRDPEDDPSRPKRDSHRRMGERPDTAGAARVDVGQADAGRRSDTSAAS